PPLLYTLSLHDALPIFPANVDEFADRWALPVDDLRLWVCLREITHHAVLGRPHVHERLSDLVGRYVSSFEVDSGGVEARLGEIRSEEHTSELQSRFDLV